MRSALLTLIALMVLAAACSSGSTPNDESADPSEAVIESSTEAERASEVAISEVPDSAEIVGRTNVLSSGNRYLPGSLDLSSSAEHVDVDFAAVWVVPLDDATVVAVGPDGSAVHIDTNGAVTTIASVDPLVRPLAYRIGEEVTLTPASRNVDSDLPDATEVQADGVRAWFDGATQRVPHGALGDTIESTRLVIARRLVSDPMDDAGDPLVTEQLIVVDLDDDPTQSVFEGLSPLLADIDGDGDLDVLTTISDGATGARLAVFDLAGERIAESSPIGRGNRWRHQIAVAPTGPNGEMEVIEVQTPHLSGRLQFQQFDDDGLVLQRGLEGFGSHVLGSRNLDGAVVFDADDDGLPDVVVPTLDLSAIAVVGSAVVDISAELVDLDGATVTSNLALSRTDTGLLFAVATSDGRVSIWRS